MELRASCKHIFDPYTHIWPLEFGQNIFFEFQKVYVLINTSGGKIPSRLSLIYMNLTDKCLQLLDIGLGIMLSFYGTLRIRKNVSQFLPESYSGLKLSLFCLSVIHVRELETRCFSRAGNSDPCFVLSAKSTLK